MENASPSSIRLTDYNEETFDEGDAHGDDDYVHDDENLISTKGREGLTIGETQNEIAASSSQDQGSLLWVSGIAFENLQIQLQINANKFKYVLVGSEN